MSFVDGQVSADYLKIDALDCRLLYKTIENKLPERDNHYSVIVRPLVNSEGFSLYF